MATDYMSILMGEDSPTTETSGKPSMDYMSILMGETEGLKEAAQEQEAKPPEEFVDETGKGAGFISFYKAAHVDTAEARRDIYAAARYPKTWKKDPDKARAKYKVERGDIYYKGEDGRWYDETPETFLSTLNLAGAQSVAAAPAMILGAYTAYRTGGMAFPALAAMVGESYRKFMGTLFGEKHNWPRWVKDVGTAGILEAAFVKGGDYVGDIANYFLRRRGGTLAKAMGKEAVTINPEEAARNYRRGKAYGIDMMPHQATGSRRLEKRFSLLRDLDESADIMEAGVRAQADQAETAVYGMLDRLAQPMGGDAAQEGLVQSARKAIKGLQDARYAKARPYYEKALAPGVKANTKEVVDWVEGAAKDAKGATAGVLKRLLRDDMLYRKVTDSKTGKLVKVPETRMSQLQVVKEELDDMIGAATRAGKNKRAGRLLEAKSKLLSVMDEASEDYAKARSIWSGESEAIEDLTKGRIVETLSRLEGDKIALASAKIMKNQTSPAAIREARGLIEKARPGAWDVGLRSHLEGVWEGLRDVSPGLKGAQFKRAIMGSKMDRNRLRAALGPRRYASWEDFMDILGMTSRGTGKESATASRLGLMGEMQEEAMGATGKLVKAFAYPLVTFKKVIYDFMAKGKFEEQTRKLAEAMLSPSAAKSISKIKQLPNGSLKQIRAFAGFMGLVDVGEFDDWQRKNPLKEAAWQGIKAVGQATGVVGRTVKSLAGLGDDEKE